MEKKKKGTWLITGASGVVVLSALLFTTCGGNKEAHFNTTIAENGTVDVTVMATGYVQPVDQIDVGTQVSGIVEKIYVDFNSHVTQGQLLAELDKSTLREKISQANASLTSSLSDQTYAQQNYDRVKSLYDQKAATQVSYEEAVNRLAQAKTAVINAQANLHQAQVNLSYADITSPIDGVILNRAVEQGQTVAASFNTPTLFTIANDLKNMQVEADVDEADIGWVKMGQTVTFSVDAYSSDVFTGTVNQIRLQPTTTNNVVTYTVIISAPNPDEKLFPGMTANISINVQSEEGVVVPQEAVVYNMSADIQKHLGISSGDAVPAPERNGIWIRTTSGIERRYVTTGNSNGVDVIITDGLNAGEEVILSAWLGKKQTSGKNGAAANPLMPSPPRGGGGRPR